MKIERLHPDDLEGKDKDILTTNATAHWQATLFKALGRIDLVAGSERPPWFVLLLVSDRVLVRMQFLFLFLWVHSQQLLAKFRGSFGRE